MAHIQALMLDSVRQYCDTRHGQLDGGIVGAKDGEGLDGLMVIVIALVYI